MTALPSIIWALAGLIASVSLAIYLWRRPDASIRMRHKDSELEITPARTQASSGGESASSLTAKPEAEPARPTPPDAPEITAVEDGSRAQRAFELLRSGQYVEGMKLMQEKARNETDVTRQVSLIAFGQHLAAAAGSEAALRDLKTTAQEHQGIFETHFWLGNSFEDLGMAQEARAELLKAYNTASNDDERATALITRSRVDLDIFRDRRVVLDALLGASKSVTEHAALSRIYGWAAEELLQGDPPDGDHAFPLYELAVRLSPYDIRLRFDVAYAYAQEGAHASAFLHYDALLRRKPEHASAANNIAVSAENLGIESVAVDYYKRSEDLGNTLATANLAQKLIKAGFLPEARSRLDPKISLPDVHRNVLDALGDVAERQVKDEAATKGVLKAAQKNQLIRTRIGEALLSNAPVGEGTYTDGDSSVFRMRVSPPGSVKGELATPTETWDLSGRIIGRAIFVEWEKRAPEGRSPLLFSSLLGRGKGQGVFVVADGSMAGFTYSGDHRADPSSAPDFKEWNFKHQ